MSAASTRIVLGFFPAESGNPQQAIESISGTEACLFGADGRVVSSRDFCSPFGALRLHGEALLVARTSDVQDTVQKIRAAGSPSVFVVQDSAGSRATRLKKRIDPAKRLLDKLRLHEQEFHEASCELEESLRLNHSLTPAAEWVLDNSYLVLTHSAEMRRHLPKHVSRLAAQTGGDSRLYRFAQEFVHRTDGIVSEANITDWLRADHSQSPLTMSELWLFPLMLRLALIERLAGLARGVSELQQIRESAYLWANRLGASARSSETEFRQMLRHLEVDPVCQSRYFAVSLAEQLQDEENALGPTQRWIEQQLGAPLDSMVQEEHTREAAERVGTANAFGSLRTLTRLEFADIFEQVSTVHAELQKDPGGIYSRSDFDTRDECRHVIEQVARYSGVSELDVARRAIQLASSRAEGHVAEYLLSSRIAELEQETGTQLPLKMRALRGIRKHSTPVYIVGVTVLTLFFTVLAVVLAREAGARHPVALAILGMLAMFPLSELSIQIVNALIVSLLPPAKLPKMDFRDRIPDEDSTLVVIPMMLSTIDAVQKELEKLEVRFLANQEANLWFGLISDFTDSADPVAPSDEILLRAARSGIDSLNAKYQGDRFVLFHRQRTWSESEQRWIGRERKRGKIEELNAFLCDENAANILVTGDLPTPIRYVLTLDSDTQLPPGTARRLVETIAHPLNRVEIDPVTRVRRRGYGIIQPRVSVALPDANATRFTRVFADASGTDPYCKAVSDAHQDLFSEGIFHGQRRRALRNHP
jgi:cyclic beta-1,2-glucan synthetase